MERPTPAEGERVDAWGHRFTWTPVHQTPQQYGPLKHSYDKLGEECVNVLNTKFPSSGFTSSSNSKRDLYAALEAHRNEDDKLQQLWDEVTDLPSWVDWDQIRRGQDVFHRYGVATITGLAYQSLLGGTAGSSHPAETLSRTGGFSLKTARKRLLETTQFVLQVTDSLGSIKPGGNGFASALRVRFLHASVRQRILQVAAAHPKYFDVQKLGVPISDADSIGTIAIFSSTIIWQSLPRQGVFLRQQEVLDYLALWRLIALYMGTPSEYFATPTKAKAIMETMLMYEYTPSATSKMLGRNIIRALENQPPLYPSRSLIEVHSRWLNGNALSDAIDIGRPPWYFWILAAAHYTMVAAFCYSSRLSGVWDRYQIDIFRRSVWAAIMEPKHEGLGSLTVFDFKYVPGLGIGTPFEEDIKEGKSKALLTADRKAMLMCLVAVGFGVFVLSGLL